MASSCRADRQPRSMASSGMDSLYQTSGGLTLDRELVSTTGSGCRRPTFTAETNGRFRPQLAIKPITVRSIRADRTVTLTFHWHVLCVCLRMTQLVLLLFLRLVLLLQPRRFLHRHRHDVINNLHQYSRVDTAAHLTAACMFLNGQLNKQTQRSP